MLYSTKETQSWATVREIIFRGRLAKNYTTHIYIHKENHDMIYR